MKTRVFPALKQGFILFGMIYSITTILSSSLQLLQAQPTDTNFHILNRAAIVFIAVITIMLFDKIRLKNPVLSYAVPYAISMGLVFFYVWLTGLVEPLHPNAYRDIFLNFTAVAACVMLVIFAKDRWLSNRKRNPQS